MRTANTYQHNLYPAAGVHGWKTYLTVAADADRITVVEYLTKKTRRRGDTAVFGFQIEMTAAAVADRMTPTGNSWRLLREYRHKLDAGVVGVELDANR